MTSCIRRNIFLHWSLTTWFILPWFVRYNKNKTWGFLSILNRMWTATEMLPFVSRTQSAFHIHYQKHDWKWNRWSCSWQMLGVQYLYRNSSLIWRWPPVPTRDLVWEEPLWNLSSSYLLLVIIIGVVIMSVEW